MLLGVKVAFTSNDTCYSFFSNVEGEVLLHLGEKVKILYIVNHHKRHWKKRTIFEFCK